jgi:hypothetical protein
VTFEKIEVDERIDDTIAGNCIPGGWAFKVPGF